MDPNANLEQQLVLAAKIQSDYADAEGNGIDQDDANRLAELVLALDGWLSRSGFRPERWRTNGRQP